MSASLDNIAADEARLADQTAAVTKQLADLIAGGGTIGAADIASLMVVRDAAVAMAARTKAVAEAVPEPPVAA